MEQRNEWFYRDASFFRSPNIRTPKRVHLPHPTALSRYGHKRALCGNIPLLDKNESGKITNPREPQKCKRCSKIHKAPNPRNN